MKWKVEQIVWITSDLSLGPARIIEDSPEGFLLVRFLRDQDLRRFAKKNPPFRRVEYRPEQRIVFDQGDGVAKELQITSLSENFGIFHFDCEGLSFTENDVIEIPQTLGVVDLLEHQHYSKLRAWRLRREAWELRSLRENSPLRGVAGCRVEILEHQLQVVARCLEMPQIRAFLCDEVGLGKTIEAGLILSALAVREKLARVVVVVPEALKVQWLTELYRRFNIRFRLDHEDMIESEDFRDYVITSFDRLSENLEGADLVIVDEAHRFLETERRQEAEILLRRARHALFLSATPLVRGVAGLQSLVEVLRLNVDCSPRVFRTRRQEIDLPSFRQLETAFTQNREEWIFHHIEEKLKSTDKEKVFLVTSHEAQVKELGRKLVNRFGNHFAFFHEGMDLIERDRQAAYFSSPEGARFLLSSEIGGEGRNFQFCSEMLLCDLPEDPAVLEQRIGRLDRIGQKKTVRVWCPVEEGSPDEFLFEAHKDIFEIFDKPWTGASLRDAEDFKTAFDEARSNGNTTAIEKLKSLLTASAQDLENLQKRLGFELFCFDPNAAALGSEVERLSDINIHPFLEELYELFGVEVEDFDTQGSLKISASSLMFVDHFPGLGGEGEKVLVFDRRIALAREDYTYFTVDHPEFIESLDLLLASDNGRLALGKIGAAQNSDLYFVFGTREANSSASLKLSAYSYRSGKSHEITSLQGVIESAQELPADRLPDAFLEKLYTESRRFFELPEMRLTTIDALLILAPA